MEVFIKNIYYPHPVTLLIYCHSLARICWQLVALEILHRESHKGKGNINEISDEVLYHQQLGDKTISEMTTYR